VKRREFITLLGSAAVAWPLTARAQQAAMPVIGFFCSASSEAYASRVAAFRQGLKESGFVAGQNVAIEYHWAEGHYDRLPAMAADLAQRKPTVIAAITTPAVLAAKAATTAIPIIFEMGTDPVESGVVTSLNRPGGNITGVSLLNVELGPKRLELLHELVPRVTIMGLLINPANRNSEVLSRDLQAAARILGIQMHVLRASSEGDFDAVFATLAQLRAGALIIGSDPFFNTRSEQLAAMSRDHTLPAIYQYRQFAEAGGLVSYGGHIAEPFRQAGGAKPADLPVVQSTRVELIINLKTAKTLSIVVPLPLLGRADEVIE
jgi:putative ABC transport system substrate-binding protein